MNAFGLLHPLLAMLLAPLLLGIINRVKAIFAGRHGQPLLQAYYDIAKLLEKGATYSATTTAIFRIGPMAGLAAIVTALCVVPFGGSPAAFSFAGDFILAAYLLAIARFMNVAAALDTGSSFEGMGASREVTFSALAEPALLLGLGAVARLTSGLSLSDMLYAVSGEMWRADGPALALTVGALIIVLLAENARMPVDDPNTHLELTMIHEVMVLDHSGPDFAFIQYGSALKLWLFSAILVGILVPAETLTHWQAVGISLIGMFVLAAIVGIIESVTARVRLVRMPQLLMGAVAIAALALILALR